MSEKRKVTKKEVEDFRQTFQLFDKDDSGSIDETELVTVLRAVGNL